MMLLSLLVHVVISEEITNCTILALNQANYSNNALALKLTTGLGYQVDIGKCNSYQLGYQLHDIPIADGENLETLAGFSYNKHYAVYKSCSAVLDGKMYIFGGDDIPAGQRTKRRVPTSVVVVEKCGLQFLDVEIPLDMMVMVL